jgi:hypothetical protein
MNKQIWHSVIINLGMCAVGELVALALFSQRIDCSQPMFPFQMLCMEDWNIFVIWLAKYIAPAVIFVGCIVCLMWDIKRIKRENT